jgi:type IV secretory pathway TrbD component
MTVGWDGWLVLRPGSGVLNVMQQICVSAAEWIPACAGMTLWFAGNLVAYRRAAHGLDPWVTIGAVGG